MAVGTGVQNPREEVRSRDEAQVGGLGTVPRSFLTDTVRQCGVALTINRLQVRVPAASRNDSGQVIHTHMPLFYQAV